VRNSAVVERGDGTPLWAQRWESADKSQPPLRVLFATNLTHMPQSFGGSQSATSEFCEALISRGWQCAVLAAIAPYDLLGLRTRLLGRTIGWRRVPADRVCGYPVYRRWSPSQEVSEAVARFKPTIAVVMAGKPGALVESLLANGVPTVCYLHDAAPDTMNWRPPKDAQLAFLACSRFIAALAKQMLDVDATFIAPIADVSRFRVDTSRRSVIMVNPVAAKGAEIALHLAQRRPDIPFEFVECWDHPPELPLIRRRARALPNVTWHKPLLDMRPIYSRGRILLAPSLWDEGWGRVVTEAQVSGIPVLASKKGGLPESVGPGGILIDQEGDLLAWEEGLARLWDDAETYLRYSQAASAHAERAEVDPEQVLAKFIECLMRRSQ